VQWWGLVGGQGSRGHVCLNTSSHMGGACSAMHSHHGNQQDGLTVHGFAKLALQPLWDIHEYVAASSAANLAAFAQKFQDALSGGMEELLKMMQTGGPSLKYWRLW
jgi:hypothetical protein